MPRFVPGLDLAAAFYDEVVQELVTGVPHSAALLGTGSDVLGFDTERSTDHGWGPRLQLFVAAADVARARRIVDKRLPDTFRGWPTHFGWDDVPVSHHVEVAVLGDWFRARLGFDPSEPISSTEWLSVPQQVLLEITSGAVFRDELDELASVREALAWYPGDVWLWLLACQWRRIDQEEPFVGRAAEVGDELGSRLLAARLVRDIVRMCFLQERRYAPYSKWLGTAFSKLRAHAELGERLLDAIAATDYRARENALVDLVRALAARHNALGVTAPVDDSVDFFHDRPFRVLGSHRFVSACVERVSDPWLRGLPLTGAIDQFVDSTDVLSEPGVFPHIAPAFSTWKRATA